MCFRGEGRGGREGERRSRREWERERQWERLRERRSRREWERERRSQRERQWDWERDAYGEREREREGILMSCQSHRYEGKDRRELYSVLNHDLETKRQNQKLVSAVQLSNHFASHLILRAPRHQHHVSPNFWRNPIQNCLCVSGYNSVSGSSLSYLFNLNHRSSRHSICMCSATIQPLVLPLLSF